MSPQATTTSEPESPPYIFNSHELRRLALYRAAVVAGFYTDLLETSLTSNSHEVERSAA